MMRKLELTRINVYCRNNGALKFDHYHMFVIYKTLQKFRICKCSDEIDEILFNLKNFY